MATKALNISLPETMRVFIEEKINKESYGTISEYVRELIREAQKKDQNQFETMIFQGINSGKTSKLTKADIAEARRTVMERITARQKAKK